MFQFRQPPLYPADFIVKRPSHVWQFGVSEIKLRSRHPVPAFSHIWQGESVNLPPTHVRYVSVLENGKFHSRCGKPSGAKNKVVNFSDKRFVSVHDEITNGEN
jgi:hypothetical protein